MENESTAKPQKTIEFRAPVGGIVHVYCNNIQMASTSFDLRLMLGEIAESTEEKIIVEQRVQVAMTWIEAKILADFLRVNIEAFEKLNGPMKLPKNIEKIVAPDTFQSGK
jgi:hypothetical protein